MDIGTKFIVIKGGKQWSGIDGGDIHLREGQVWDIVGSSAIGPQFRKLNSRGGSTCILNGFTVARCALRDGRVRELLPTEPEYIAHDELRKRTGAR